MSLLPRKSALAIAAVTDVALNARMGALSGKALAKSLHLPSRHLEPLLQALTREGILKAVRGPHGGYVLAREQRRITAADILRAAKTVDDESEEPVSGSALIVGVVGPSLAEAENAFSDALSRITIEDLARSAAPKLRKATK
jgi:Rrf2 family iron-sulfur cluster assembly transcriptional regulator